MSIRMDGAVIRKTLIISSLAAFAASAAWPAAAQQRTTIGRLPSAIYLPEAGAAAGVQDKGVVKSLSTLAAPNLDLKGVASTPAAVSEKVQSFVTQNAKELGLDGSAAKLVVKNTRETLTGRYVDLEQQLDGIPIIDGNVQLTVGNEGKVQSVARNVVDVPTAAAATVKKTVAIEPNAADDIVWNDLKATGNYLEQPTTEKAYLNENNVLTLIYVVKMAVSKPLGYWEYHVDANTGRIISKKDRAIKEGKRATLANPVEPPPVPPAIADRNAALLKFNQAKAAAKALNQALAKAATGKGLVFEPNPVSSLNNPNLQDGDPPSKFDQAYVQVDLVGLTDVNGTLNLQGALVRIEDFEPGDGSASRPPSTSTGSWTARRGDNAFNDVMTYYYINSSLTYLQKLGYTGAKDLFPTGIAADSDGVDGDDNSHFVPGSDKLAFGHGCVDDNEDTDVIFHELGHAIHTHVNPQWGGGDSGAIGEGFGDYWAISQRKQIKNGFQVDPVKVFEWDGIAMCWPGRRADRLNARYEPTRIYQAHTTIPGGFQSDELWSTPLVTSLLELTNNGESIESVDKVVLEGMAGIGSNFTMRQLALNTVAQAKVLFPGKPHAAVFEKHFKHHAIIP
jgi:zinc metalloprotease ZmpB